MTLAERNLIYLLVWSITNVRFGSEADSFTLHRYCPLSGIKQTHKGVQKLLIFGTSQKPISVDSVVIFLRIGETQTKKDGYAARNYYGPGHDG